VGLPRKDKLPNLYWCVLRSFFSSLREIPRLGHSRILQTRPSNVGESSSKNPVDSVMALMPPVLGGQTSFARRWWRMM
jgi:hypothetical protein